MTPPGQMTSPLQPHAAAAAGATAGGCFFVWPRPSPGRLCVSQPGDSVSGGRCTGYQSQSGCVLQTGVSAAPAPAPARARRTVKVAPPRPVGGRPGERPRLGVGHSATDSKPLTFSPQPTRPVVDFGSGLPVLGLAIRRDDGRVMSPTPDT